MGRSFSILDGADGNRKVDKQEFYYGLQDLGAGITKREADLLLTLLDIN
jgi:calcyphosin